MSLIKTFFYKIGHLLLSIVKTLGRIIYCKRRKEGEHLLPMTIRHIIKEENVGENAHEFDSHWELWPDSSTSSTPCSSSSLTGGSNRPEQDFEKVTQDDPSDDFFRDMVPQIRKPKIYLKQDMRESEDSQMCSNRLALDPKIVMIGPDLGTIEDNPSNWEDDETLNESWDPNALIRETKRAEREKRLAEHQHRKLERESRRSSKQDASAKSLIMSLSDTKDKAKCS